MAPDEPTPEVVAYRMDRVEQRLDRLETNLNKNTVSTNEIASLLRNGQVIRERRVKRAKWWFGAAVTLLTVTQPAIYRAIGL